MKNIKIEKYLRRNYSERKTEPGQIIKKYKGAIVIPVCSEYHYISKTFQTLAVNKNEYLKDTLILLVINNPEFSHSAQQSLPSVRQSETRKNELKEFYDDNQLLLEKLRRKQFESIDNLELFWLDCSTHGQGLPGRGGVGVARKIGMDYVLNYLDLSLNPLLICLDGDTQVDDNYLEQIYSFFDRYKNIAGATVSYEHQSGDTLDNQIAIEDYELSLRYYYESLLFADSPYAYFTIGSTMVSRASTYVQSGGMKNKDAAEDFYFLQALRKTGKILEIDGTRVYPSARISNRVPFGTGAKVTKLLNGEFLLFYNPLIFIELKEVISVAKIWLNGDNVSDAKFFIEKLSVESKEFFVSYNFLEQWVKIYSNSSIKDRNADRTRCSDALESGLIRSFHVWFDAFKTLKYVHFLENNYKTKFPRVHKTEIQKAYSAF